MKELWLKIKEALISALPITAIVYILAMTPMFNLTAMEIVTFTISAVMLVLGIGILNGFVDEGHVGTGHALFDDGFHRGIMFFKSFHICQLSFARRRICMVRLRLRSALTVPGVR